MDQKTLIRNLYSLGFSKKKVEELADVDRGTVDDATRNFGEEAVFANRPKNPQDVFVAALRRYAEIESKREYKKEANVLASWLGVEEIVTMLTGAMLAMSQLLVPGYDQKYQPYVALLEQVFGGLVRDVSVRQAKAQAGARWQQILEHLRAPEVACPRSHDELCNLVVEVAVSPDRTKIMPIWDETVFGSLDQAISRLDLEQASLLRERFGIGTAGPKKLIDIAKERSLKREQVRNLEARAVVALRGLMEELDYRGLFLQPVGDTLRRCLLLSGSHEAAQKYTIDVTGAFMIPFDNDRIMPSVRLDRLLTQNKYHLIGEVVQKSEGDLLKEGFGRQSIKELRNLLRSFALDLGMMLGPEERRRISEAKAAYLRRQGV